MDSAIPLKPHEGDFALKLKRVTDSGLAIHMYADKDSKYGTCRFDVNRSR